MRGGGYRKMTSAARLLIRGLFSQRAPRNLLVSEIKVSERVVAGRHCFNVGSLIPGCAELSVLVPVERRLICSTRGPMMAVC